MRELDKALAALALRVSPTRPPEAERRLVPAVDDADSELLERAFRWQQRVLIASLWPAPTRQCVAAPLYAELPAPAVFGRLFRVSWPAAPIADARALQARLSEVFPAGPEREAELGVRAA